MASGLEDYVRALEQRRVVDTVYVASAVILFYDLILTLHLEISLVWFSKWNYTKVLYLLTRYIPFGANALILYSHLVPNSSDVTCARTFEAAGWLYLVGLDLAEVVLAVRTWACWGRNKWVGICLAVCTLLCQIPSAIFMHNFLGSLRFGSPGAGRAPSGCFVIDSNRLLWVDWLAFLIGEGVNLVLMASFAYRTLREGNNTPLIRIVYRDGLIFYAYLFCLTSINIALTLVLDNGFVAMVSPAQSAIHSVLTTRIILGIREAASRRLDDHSFDLHLSDTDSRASRSRLCFAEPQDVFLSDDSEKDGVFQRRGSYEGDANVGWVSTLSTPTRTVVSHVTLPMTRDARGKRVVGRAEPEDEDDDDDGDSVHAFPEEWV